MSRRRCLGRGAGCSGVLAVGGVGAFAWGSAPLFVESEFGFSGGVIDFHFGANVHVLAMTVTACVTNTFIRQFFDLSTNFDSVAIAVIVLIANHLFI